jgi:hypothetical protein
MRDKRAAASSVWVVAEDDVLLALAVVLSLFALDEEEVEGTRDEMLRLGLEEVERGDFLLEPDFLPPELTFDFLLFAILDLHAGGELLLGCTIRLSCFLIQATERDRYIENAGSMVVGSRLMPSMWLGTAHS